MIYFFLKTFFVAKTTQNIGTYTFKLSHEWKHEYLMIHVQHRIIIIKNNAGALFSSTGSKEEHD